MKCCQSAWGQFYESRFFSMYLGYYFSIIFTTHEDHIIEQSQKY